jgi:hypothetical protein
MLVDALLIVDLQAMARLLPEFQQLLLRGIAKVHLADDRQFDRRRHHELAARILEYRAAKRILLDGLVAQTEFLRCERGGEARRARADDQYVDCARVPRFRLRDDRGNRLERLLALRQRILDEAHAAELAGHIDAGHVRFEVRLEHRNVEPAPFGAEHERDCIERTGALAGAVPDALARADQHGLAVDQAEHIVVRGFRAGFDAGSAAEALRGIDDRVQRCGLGHPGGHAFLLRLQAAQMQYAAADAGK